MFIRHCFVHTIADHHSDLQWDLFRLNELISCEAMLQRILKEDCEMIVNKYEVYRTALNMQMEKKRQEQLALSEQ